MINFNELTKKKDDPLFQEYNISGIYGIFIDNELVYIGSSIHCMERFLQHKYKVLLKEEDRCIWHKDYIPLYQELRKAYANNQSIDFDILHYEKGSKLRKLERKLLSSNKPKLNVKAY